MPHSFLHRQPKIVADPVSGIVDISPVLPLVETPEFQALADKRQLGMTYLVFRAATHTRFNHCVGAFGATRTLSDRWFLDGVITREERDALCAYALLHDIGHPPFSHVTEDFCALDDDEMTLFIIKNRLRKTIEECGIDPDLVESLADHSNPLYLAVHDKNLGTEKLDYLERDGFYTILNTPTGIKYLRQYIYFVDGQVVIDEKVVEPAIDAQTFYMKMYKSVYLRKSLVIAQRMFHKMVFHLTLCDPSLLEILPGLTDTELLTRVIGSTDPFVQDLYRRLRERRLFREAIVLRPERFVHETRIRNKPIAVFGISPERAGNLIASANFQKREHGKIEQFENLIADETLIPRGEILVVPVFDPHRFRAKDVMIYASDGQLHSLRERRPAHFHGMEETAQAYFALRICTSVDYREHLSSPAVAQRVFEIIMQKL